MSTDTPASPQGALVISTMAMPKDTNGNGDIFGGWLVSQMDIAGAIFAKHLAKGRVATVAINSLAFQRPVSVGDVVSCYAALEKMGRTSMTIHIEVWITADADASQYKVTEGSFVFVALDENMRPRPVQSP